MRFYVVILLILFNSTIIQLSINEPLLVFHIPNRGIFRGKFGIIKSNPEEKDFKILAKPEPYYVGDIDYSLRANLIVWRQTDGIYASPIDKSKTNLLLINGMTKLLNIFVKNSNIHGIRLSIDWIHNLVYYEENKLIIVFNLTDTRYTYIAIREYDYITGLSVYPMESLIFYCTNDLENTEAKIIKASQHGLNRTLLRKDNIKHTDALTVDIVSKNVFWFDSDLDTYSSVDFEGNNLKTFIVPEVSYTFHSMQIFGNQIYWTQTYSKFIFESKLGMNATQTNYLMRSKDNQIHSFKIIDSSLQLSSTNRCFNSNCSYLCLPISINQYKCVCPQSLTYNEKKLCEESSHPVITRKKEDYYNSKSETLTKYSLFPLIPLLYIHIGLIAVLSVILVSIALSIYLKKKRNSDPSLRNENQISSTRSENNLLDSVELKTITTPNPTNLTGNSTKRIELDNLVVVYRKPMIGETSTDIRTKIKREFFDSYKKDRITVDISDLNLREFIGRGHFGSICKGILNSAQNNVELVAVKKLEKTSCHSEKGIKSFLFEGLIMKDFNHINIMGLRGICFGEDDLPMILLPYMANGDLLSYIRDERNLTTVKDLLIFALGIANGMDYLSNQRYVHRDLAARNCLLDSHLCVKIADFGLSRDVYGKNYYRLGKNDCALPLKWMSYESIEKLIFTTESDVWSYGVVLWELITRGTDPYPKLANSRVFDYLKKGYRLPKPEYCPKSIYLILQECWSKNPNSRPSFATIYERIKRFIDEANEV